jgi:hypothetical protein
MSQELFWNILNKTSIVSSLLGLFVSLWAAIRAGAAKDAAEKALASAKRQTIVYESIPQIVEDCVLEKDINFFDLNLKFKKINDSAMGIIGQCDEDQKLKDSLDLVKNSLLSIQNILKDSSEMTENLFSIFSPPFIILSGNLKTLQSKL